MPSTGFGGGIHLPDFKEVTREGGIEQAGLPRVVRIPVQQHIGAPATPIVKLGQHVDTGQCIAEAGGYVSAFVHASVSGTVSAIRCFPHPLGDKRLAIEIESDGNDTHAENIHAAADTSSLSPKEIVDAVYDCGIVGMGGAAFPTHVKINPPEGSPIQTLILNGAECEPFLSCDFRLMVERPEEVIRGSLLMKKAVSAERVIIGIEENKPEAVAALSKAAASLPEVSVETLEEKYPQGCELQLIKSLTGVELPKTKLPLEAGFVVQNVATSFAVFEALAKGKPLIERVVTIAGSGVARPCNLLVRVGTMLRDLLEQAGGVAEDAEKVILGGPMTGLAQHTLDVPVIKGTSGIIVFRRPEIHVFDALPCIRCNRCETYCPAGLAASRIGLAMEFGELNTAESLAVAECMECGCCSYVCPSKRPMTHYMKSAKAEIMQKKQRDGAARGE